MVKFPGEYIKAGFVVILGVFALQFILRLTPRL